VSTDKVIQKDGTIKFDNLLGLRWCNIDKKECNLVQELCDFLDQEPECSIVHIGTDAQKNGLKDRCNYVLCVIVHSPQGRGCRVFYLKFKNVRTSNLWEKLFTETMLSLQVAVELSTTEEVIRDHILVHVDANPNPKYQSSSHVKALAGMITGYGFKHVLKPDSWCSSHAADHIVKGKN